MKKTQKKNAEPASAGSNGLEGLTVVGGAVTAVPPIVSEETEIAKGLDKIGVAAKGLKLSLPKTPKIPSLVGLKGTMEEMKAAVSQMDEGVANALKFINDSERRLHRCHDNIERKIVARATKETAQKMREYLDEALGLEDGILRASAAVAYIRETLSGQYDSADEARKALADLTDHGLLVLSDENGRIMIGYQHYDVSGKFELDEDDLAKVSGVVAAFSRGLVTLEKQRRVEQTKTMGMEATITIDEVNAGKNGRCLMEVPAEQMDGGKWRGGGFVLLEFRENNVAPIRASGAVEGLIAKMVEMGVRLPRYTLDARVPPGGGNHDAFCRVVDAVRRDKGLSIAEAEEVVRKEQALWYLIRRGLKSHHAKKLLAKSIEELKGKAEITGTQFFGLNGSEGKPVTGKMAYLEFPGDFNQGNSQTISSPFFLATRSEEGGFEVTELPAHLQPILGHHVGKKYPGFENDQDCPPQIGRLLRAIRGKEEMAVMSTADTK